MAVKAKDKGKKTQVKAKTIVKGKVIEDKKQKSLISIVKEERSINNILASKIILKPNLTVNKELIKEQVISRYTASYLLSCDIYLKRGSIIDAKTFNRCCELLRASRNIDHYDMKSVELVIKMIKDLKYIIDPVTLIYIYANSQTELFRFIREFNNFVEDYDSNNTVDIAYRIVFDELCLKYRSNIFYIGGKDGSSST